MSIEFAPSDELERVLTVNEKLAFADDVIWPAVDHLYGANFRQKAAHQKKAQLRPRTFFSELNGQTERITIEAYSPKGGFTTSLDGEREKICWVNLIIEEFDDELKEGIKTVLDTEGFEPQSFTDEDESSEDEETDEDDAWWHDEAIEWIASSGKVYNFANTPKAPFQGYYEIQAQLDDDDEDFIWSAHIEPDQPPQSDEDVLLEAVETELEQMLSYRECLEIRAALIRCGVPAEKMAQID